jgi:hypothetical protein
VVQNPVPTARDGTRQDVKQSEWKGLGRDEIRPLLSTANPQRSLELIPLTGVETSPVPTEKTCLSRGSGPDSGAVPGPDESAALSLLHKLTAGLTADERAALAQMLAHGKPS